MKKSFLAAFVLLGAAAYGLNWDNALIMGTTPGEEVSAFDPLDAVRAALARGEKKVVLPKRLYLVKPKDNGFYLRLKDLSDTVIDFSGSELRGLVNTGFFHLEDCTNVTIRNVELDYCDLPFTQARIVSADKDGTQTLEIIDGYPRPSGEDVGGWPFQVYDKDTLELKNPMRMGAGFKLERLADGRYRVSGGGNRAGAVGDIAVWSMPSPKGAMEGDHVSVRDVIHSRATVRCVFENVTEYATPGGRAFEEHLTEANVYRNCRIVRRPPETDFAKRGLKRLRSGNHDAFMSRRAVVGPKILGCTALYHCDDAVNISGMYGVVYEVKGNEVRLLEYTPTVFRAGDTAQAMSADGRTLPRMAVKAVGAREAMTAEERAYMTTIGLWRGLDKLCRTATRVTVDDASALHRGDAVISDRAQGNGFEIRGCHFGRNRAFCVRMRASNGTIADNVFDRPEGCGIYLGPEYEWLEGGLSENVTITNNIFVGCKPHIGGTAAHRKHIPREAYRNVSVHVLTGETPVVPVARLDPIPTNVSDVRTDALSSEWKAYLSVPAGYVFERRTERVQTWNFPEFTVESYRQANGPGTEQRVFLAVPKGRKGRLPAVAVPFYYPEAMLGFDPATGEELPKFKGVTMLADLARRGFVAATADAYHLTYRLGAGEPRDDFRRWAKAADALARDWPCWTGIGKLTADTRLVIDLLAADPRVDAARIGIIGHSLGGKMAFYAGCLDPRVKVIVTSDWGIDWDRTNWKDPWYWGAARVAAMKAAGRTHADLLSYAGGKPFMLIAGKYDNAASARAVLDAVPSCRDPERCVILDHASGHRPPPDALEAGYRFLDKFLKPNANNKETK